jgi:hypothetical protein
MGAGPPSYDHEFLIASWIAHSNAHAKTHAIDRLARYAPEIGWRAILAVLNHPKAPSHNNLPSHALEMLISQYGDLFIDRIEHEAAASPTFKACLAEIHPSPIFPFTLRRTAPPTTAARSFPRTRPALLPWDPVAESLGDLVG